MVWHLSVSIIVSCVSSFRGNSFCSARFIRAVYLMVDNTMLYTWSSPRLAVSWQLHVRSTIPRRARSTPCTSLPVNSCSQNVKRLCDEISGHFFRRTNNTNYTRHIDYILVCTSAKAVKGSHGGRLQERGQGEAVRLAWQHRGISNEPHPFRDLQRAENLQFPSGHKFFPISFLFFAKTIVVFRFCTRTQRTSG